MSEQETIIDAYTRQDAINDGMLVDVSDTSEAKEAGFKIPVCLTKSVQELCEVPNGLEGMQDYKGRLWDVLFMAAQAFRRKKEELVEFKVSFLQANQEHKEATLWLVFNPHEGFTIMLPEDY